MGWLRRASLLAVSLSALAAAGCGGANGTTHELRQRLLSAGDLPVGWKAAPSGSEAPTLTNAPCLSGLSHPAKGLTHVTAGFVDGTSIPNLGEALVTGPEVAATWTKLTRALAACRSAALRLGRTTVQVTTHPVGFPRLGSASSAYAWSFSLGGVRLGFDLVLFRTGPYGGSLSYADLGAPRTGTVAAFARAALAKAASGSTAPVPDSVSIASQPVQTVHTTMGTVAYRALGSGPPLLLVTGYSGTMEDWDRPFVDALARRHRVVMFDNAGVGRTQALPAPLTIDAMADQTSALVAALHLGRTSVLGWSMGSMIAQALAVRHPSQLSQLILCAGYPGNGSAVRPSLAVLNQFESGRSQEVMATLFPAGQAAAQSTYLAAISSYPGAAPAPAGVLSAQGHAVDGWWAGSDPAGNRTAAIATPTLVADGKADRLDPPANSHILARLIPGVRTLKLYPDAGHDFLFQDEASFVPLIESFLSSAHGSARPAKP